MLNKILIIDDSPEIKDFIKYCISRVWPAVEIDIYDPVQGQPDEEFNWDPYDLLILDYQLGLADEAPQTIFILDIRNVEHLQDNLQIIFLPFSQVNIGHTSFSDFIDNLISR